MKHHFFVMTLLSVIYVSSLRAQQYLYPVDSVYLSGMVFNADSSLAISGAHVFINQGIVAVTNESGQFLIYMSVADTLLVTYLGFKNFNYFFSEKLFENEFFMRIPLSNDTMKLLEVEIYPWPKKGAFKQAFLAAQATDKKVDKIIIPGAIQNDQPKSEKHANLSNPASLLQEKLGKKGRYKRKENRNRKKLQKVYYEHEN